MPNGTGTTARIPVHCQHISSSDTVYIIQEAASSGSWSFWSSQSLKEKVFLLHFPFFFFVLLFFTNSVSLNWKWELDECGEPCLLSSAFLKDRLTTFAHEFCRWPGQEKSVIQEKLIPSFQMKCSLKRKPALSPGRGKHLKCGRSKMAVGLIWSSSGARWGQKELGVGQKSLWAG